MSTSVSVHSDPDHQTGQSHRSSENFSTESLEDWGNIQWTVEGGGGGDVSFDVWIDISGGKDKHPLSGVKNGSVTKFVQSRKLYIANPKNADTEFKVIANSYKK